MTTKRIFCQPAFAYRVLFTSFIGLLLLTPWTLSHAESAVHYAAPASRGSGDCGSWDDACSLQTALATAIGGDQIWVQMGVHKPTDTTDRTISFDLPTEVAVYGGFAGTEGQLDQRDWQANLTVLSGDIDNNDITDPTGVVTATANIVGDNSYHVVNSVLLTTTTRLDGFVVTAGQANGDNPPLNLGGGLNNEYSNPTVTNVTFSGNSAFLGGGMFNYESSPTLTNTIFNGNTADYGGGMYNYISNPTLTYVTFNGNTADYGGGICNHEGSPSLTEVTFDSNSANEDGGGISNDYSSPTLNAVTFSGNSANNDGGGMWSRGWVDHQSNQTLIDVVFQGNTAVNNGGGVFDIGSTLTLTNVQFTDNSAIMGGGIYNEFGDLTTLTDVVFTGNTAVYGGGISVYKSSPTVTAVTFSNNDADFGGGLHNNESSPALTNVTFTGNTGLYGAGIYNEVASDPTLTAVTFSSNQATWDGGGMYNNASSPTLTNVSFSDNGVYNGNGGGLHNIDGSAPTLVNVLFAGNSANLSGGGVYNYMNSSSTLTNVTFSNNTAVFYDGGGLYNGDNSNSNVFNSIFWGNSAGQNGDQLFNESEATIAYSDIQNSGGSGDGWDSVLGVDGGGNIDADPLFVAEASGNLHLHHTSPAIDAGDNDAVPIDVTTDLAGNPRFVDVASVPDTGNGTPPIVDMGAYEAAFADVSLVKAVYPETAVPGGPITFTLSISNSGSVTATQVIVTDTLPAYLSVSSVLTSGIVISDTGQLPAYVWTVQDLALGQGGVITLTGNLITPLAAGIYTNTASVAYARDSETAVETTSISYTVANVAPLFTSTAITTATQDTLYSYPITTEDENGDVLTITAVTLPAWLTLTDLGDGTALLSGTPTSTDSGAHLVELQVSDSGGLSDTQSFTIMVAATSEFRLYLPLLLK